MAFIGIPARSGGRLAVLDKLGVVVALVMAAAWAWLPFMLFRANRIVAGESKALFESLPHAQALAFAGFMVLSLAIVLVRTPTSWRLALSGVGLVVLLVLVGNAASFLTPAGNRIARVSPGASFWLLLGAYALVGADALTRLRLRPWPRLAILALVALLLALFLMSGLWRDLSIMREYANRADSFWREARAHVALAFGSLVVAAVVGIPLGIVCFRLPRLRTVVLNVLNAIQTIPSIALFGLLIAPLAWISAEVPGARAVGISGIGVAPAMVALFAYSLLPMVANTVVGLAGVPEQANDAARGMGMTDVQRLVRVEMPLAFPVILTGIRIVLVQNIGLATVAALIGGGGFGVFVFQGIGQTAMDLVLLGAVPTVALAFASAVVLDALVEMVSHATVVEK
jgi:osmoprotectant transport system permease protein